VEQFVDLVNDSWWNRKGEHVSVLL